MPNRLAEESSPYLAQHAHNPVDWYPWGDEALTRAREEDRPIVLSIGYSSCHWCHVMERESFEDPSVAALMNRHFVSIKVDREERPDIDQVYMKAVQAMTGSGGWPMTVFLTPALVPYYGGTYFPPEPRHGMPSFAQVLAAAADAFVSRRDAVEKGGATLLEALERSSLTRGPAGAGEGPDALDTAYRTLSSRYDPVHGGFGQAPKFPQPVTLELLLRHHVRTGDPAALEMAVHTLRRMAAGGMRDHLGGGFHRYSVDARWLVPHFEKMLYDNALLARAFLDAYRVTGSDDLRDVVTDTLDYLLADMRAPEGGFYSARDADSEGEEGTFYVWSPEEIERLLGTDEGRLFCRVYDVSASGNFEGRSILHLPHGIDAVARSEGVTSSALERRLADARHTLLEARAHREPPFRDEKILTSWNALAVRALAEAGATLSEPRYLEAATRGASFLWDQLGGGSRLLHTWMDGEAKIPAFLDDHAALGNALLSLHGATLERRWLDGARWLCGEILARFWDEEAGTVYDTASDAERLIVRPRDPMDNATPSGPSLAAELLTRAGHALDVPAWSDAAGRIIAHEADHLGRYGPAFGRMLSVLDRRLAQPVEIAIVGRRADETSGTDDTTGANDATGTDDATAADYATEADYAHMADAATMALVRAAHATFHGDLTVMGRLEGDSTVLGRLEGDADEVAPTLPLLEGRELVDGRPTAYVCRGYACRLPVTDAADVARESAALDPVHGRPLRGALE